MLPSRRALSRLPSSTRTLSRFFTVSPTFIPWESLIVTSSPRTCSLTPRDMSRLPTLEFLTCFACAGRRQPISAKVFVAVNPTLRQSSLIKRVCRLYFFSSCDQSLTQSPSTEYDARLVDVWAIAVVYYCMNFQELPWRLAKPSDPSFGPYLQSYSSTLSPAPLGNLVPRECRAVIKKMLEPDPKKRVGVMEILAEDWVRKIEVLPKEDGVGGAPPEVQTAGLPSSSYPVAAPVAPVALPAALPAPVIAPTTPTLPET